jgi:chorismate dehydratase
MSPIRLGCVQYLNTLPLIEGLRSWRDAEIETAVPSRLIDMLLEKRVDVALASVIDFAKSARAGVPRVTLLPAGMIGCDGTTLTVRLFSRVPIERVERVCVDTDSHTSAALVQVIMQRLYGRRVRAVDYDAREHMVLGERPGDSGDDALLLIGDKVVTDAPSSETYPHQLDLGEAWKKLTGLPFVYAAWMCRAGEESTPEVLTAAAMLDRQRRHNQTRLDWIVESRASEKHWPEELAAKYVGAYLKYDVGEAEREAVEKFLRWSAELGLCERVEPMWGGVGRTKAWDASAMRGE